MKNSAKLFRNLLYEQSSTRPVIFAYQTHQFSACFSQKIEPFLSENSIPSRNIWFESRE